MGTIATAETVSLRRAWGLTCCTDRAFSAWYVYARENAYLTHGGASLKTFCADCTPEFEASMRRRGRCIHSLPREWDWEIIRNEPSD